MVAQTLYFVQRHNADGNLHAQADCPTTNIQGKSAKKNVPVCCYYVHEGLRKDKGKHIYTNILGRMRITWFKERFALQQLFSRWCNKERAFGVGPQQDIWITSIWLRSDCDDHKMWIPPFPHSSHASLTPVFLTAGVWGEAGSSGTSELCQTRKLIVCTSLK